MGKKPIQIPDRICYLDRLRLWAMAGVIVIHQAATGYSEAAAGSWLWAVCLLYNTLARFSVPVFVMISGAVFLDPRKPVTAANMFGRTVRLLALFGFWSLPYAVLETLREYGSLVLVPLLRKLLKGHYHMWYLHLIAVLYLLTPLLRQKHWRRVLAPAAFVLGCCMSMLPAAPAQWGYAAYLGYYCLGYRLSRAAFSRKQMFALTGFSLLVMAAAMLWLAPKRPELIFRESMPHILFYSASVFLLAKGCGPKLPPWAGSVTSCQRSIYLIHPAFNFLLRRIGLYALAFEPIFCIPICSLLVGVMSYAAVRIMKRFPILRYFS